MRRTPVVLAVLVLTSGLTAAPSWAAPPKQAVDEAAQHCVVTAVQVGVAAPERAAPPRCFATFAEAVAEATDGRVVLPPDATTLDEETLEAAQPPTDGMQTTSATILGIEFEHKYFGGWSYLIQSTNPRGCAGYSYRVPSLPSGRNNEISSAKTYASCKSSHYSGTNMTGSRYLCGCSQMGTMNDQTSSIFFSSTGFRS